MEPRVFIPVLFLLSIYHHTHVQSSDEGFVSIDLFKKGIDFGKDLAIKKGISSLIPFEVPQIEAVVKIPLIGTVYFTLSNMTLYEANVSSSTVQPADTGLVLVVSGAKASLTMDWSYKYVSLIVVISDEGTASVQVESMEVDLTLGLKNQEGKLKLSLLDCICKVKDLSIKLEGGASWLYQGIVDAFEKLIRSAIEGAITEQIGNVIFEFDSILQTLPKVVQMDQIAALNVTFVNDPVLDSSSIGVKIDGLVTPVDGVLAFGHYTRNIESLVYCGGPAKMGGISIHEKVLNSASAAYFNAGIMNLILDHQCLLNTADWKYIIPQLYQQYPNADMILNISVSSPPIFSIAHQSIDTTIYVDFTIEVLDASEVIPVACISLLFTSSGYPEFSRGTITGSIKLNDFAMSLKWSTIGILHVEVLEPFVELLLRSLAVPYLNLVIYWGLPLPTLMGYTLHNARFNYVDSQIIVCTDVHPVKKQNFYPVTDEKK